MRIAPLMLHILNSVDCRCAMGGASAAAATAAGASVACFACVQCSCITRVASGYRRRPTPDACAALLAVQPQHGLHRPKCWDIHSLKTPVRTAACGPVLGPGQLRRSDRAIAVAPLVPLRYLRSSYGMALILLGPVALGGSEDSPPTSNANSPKVVN